MSLYATCDQHTDYPRSGCLDCHGAKSSAHLEMVRRLRAGMLTPDEEERLRPLKDRVTLDDRVRAYDDEGTVIPLVNWEELIEGIERSVIGETDAP
jgi:hypothetical protein